MRSVSVVRFARVAIRVIIAAQVCLLSGCFGGGAQSAKPTVRPHTSAPPLLSPVYPGTTVSIPPPGAEPPLRTLRPPGTSLPPGRSLPPQTSMPPSESSTLPPVPPAPNQHSFPGDGRFMVGKDIEPGTYRSPGGTSCYWDRLRGLSGSFEDSISTGAGDWPQVAEIAASDVAFETHGCTTWVPAAGAPAPTTTTSATTTTTAASGAAVELPASVATP
ncbi:hypothetical protein [Mycobacterium sp.]|uniref:hypothetical protein n=1 Tax=Mycobacterium sp. TaxID=1785 RepID=UPI003A872ED0